MMLASLWRERASELAAEVRRGSIPVVQFSQGVDAGLESERNSLEKRDMTRIRWRNQQAGEVN
jgi:hypothetical protein